MNELLSVGSEGVGADAVLGVRRLVPVRFDGSQGLKSGIGVQGLPSIAFNGRFSSGICADPNESKAVFVLAAPK